MSDQNAPTQRHIKHSGLGLTSFAISLFAGVLLVLGLNIRSTETIAIFGLIFGVVGFALCIASLFQKEKKKLFPILGMIVTSPIILLAVGLFFLHVSHPGN